MFGNPKNERSLEILLIEDNPADVRLTVEALKETRIPNNLNVVNDGVEAMSFLSRVGKHENSPRPDIILMDLNLPKKDGREVLAEIKLNEGLRNIPVIVLTTSGAEQDILHCYNLHANCYIRKPVDMEQFIVVMQCIEKFWFNIVSLPDSL